MTNADPALLAQLLDEWQARLQRGERPSLDDYIARYPDLADEIRQLFPGVAALADADPPQNKAGNPRRLGYALLHRKSSGDELSSTFASVIEPYRKQPFIPRKLPRTRGRVEARRSMREAWVIGTR